MSTSAHGTAGPWSGGPPPADEAVAEPPALPEPDLDVADRPGHRVQLGFSTAASDWDGLAEDRAEAGPSEWSEGAEWASEGLTGRAVVVIALVPAAGCAALDLALTSGRLTFFFDLCFVVICLATAMAVRRRDLFTAGVLPPLVFAGVIAVLAFAEPQAFQSAPGVDKVFLTGLADHAGGLVGGYAATLSTIAARVTAPQRRHPH
jgi:Domain of unknown function (DUF6542)